MAGLRIAGGGGNLYQRCTAARERREGVVAAALCYVLGGIFRYHGTAGARHRCICALNDSSFSRMRSGQSRGGQPDAVLTTTLESTPKRLH
jgi:hypothetical protein